MTEPEASEVIVTMWNADSLMEQINALKAKGYRVIDLRSWEQIIWSSGPPYDRMGSAPIYQAVLSL